MKVRNGSEADTCDLVAGMGGKRTLVLVGVGLLGESVAPARIFLPLLESARELGFPDWPIDEIEAFPLQR